MMSSHRNVQKLSTMVDLVKSLYSFQDPLQAHSYYECKHPGSIERQIIYRIQNDGIKEDLVVML